MPADSPWADGRIPEHHCATAQYRLKDDLGCNRLLRTPLWQAATGAAPRATRRGPWPSRRST